MLPCWLELQAKSSKNVLDVTLPKPGNNIDGEQECLMGILTHTDALLYNIRTVYPAIRILFMYKGIT